MRRDNIAVALGIVAVAIAGCSAATSPNRDDTQPQSTTTAFVPVARTGTVPAGLYVLALSRQICPEGTVEAPSIWVLTSRSTDNLPDSTSPSVHLCQTT